MFLHLSQVILINNPTLHENQHYYYPYITASMRKNKRNVLPLLGMRIYVHSEQRTEEICGASRGAHTVQKLVNKVLLVYYH